MNNPFIKFQIENTCECNVMIPICHGSDIEIMIYDDIDHVFFATHSGDDIIEAECQITGNNLKITHDISSLFGIGDVFVLKYAIQDGYKYSTPLIYIGCDESDTVLFKYSNEIESYRTRLYCIVDNPQPKTSKDEYETISGDVKILSKTRRKEYEVEFYFYPEEIHDSIEEMLCFPNLTVDEIPMYESGDYEIDWESKDENGNARSTTKLSEQNITKYSNC